MLTLLSRIWPHASHLTTLDHTRGRAWRGARGTPPQSTLATLGQSLSANQSPADFADLQQDRAAPQNTQISPQSRAGLISIAAHSLPPTTRYALPTTRCALPTTYYILPTTYYLLPTTHYLLLAAHYALRTTHYALRTTHYALRTTHYLLCTTYYL